MKKIKLAWIFIQAFLFVGLSGCFKDPMTEKAFTPQQVKLYNKGKGVYNSVCITCHNINPKLPGAIGPENYGSSLELVKLKVLKGTYPKGYKPKRPSSNMPVFDDQKDDIEALHFYLNN